MKKYILLGGLLLLSLSACGTERSSERAKVGQIGAESSVSREMAAKTIALAFYTNQELDEMETKLDFSDLSEEDWAYPYIQGCVEQGFFAGSEEGTFRPQADLTLWEAQALMDRLAPDYNSRIVLTAENKNMAVSYELWVQLLETVLKARRGEDSLYSYGIQTENALRYGQIHRGRHRFNALCRKPHHLSGKGWGNPCAADGRSCFACGKKYLLQAGKRRAFSGNGGGRGDACLWKGA